MSSAPRGLRRALGAITVLMLVALAFPGAPRADRPPITAPVISGNAIVGAALHATTGSWSDPSATPTYQWVQCAAGPKSCAAIAGATSLDYLVASTDLGYRLGVVLTVTDSLGQTATASSDLTPAVTSAAPAGMPPAITAAPVISGTPVVGSTLQASAGTWTGDPPITPAYQWLSCKGGGKHCAAIPGETSLQHLVTDADADRRLAVELTVANALGTAVTVSALTDFVAPASAPGPDPAPVPRPAPAPGRRGTAPFPPSLLQPFPVVRVRGRLVRGGALVTLFTVRTPIGVRIDVRCAGHGCPTPFVSYLATRTATRIRPFERYLRAGLRLAVDVTAPGLIGKYTSMRIRSGKAPLRRDRCLMPGGSRPVRCPA
jgi:hypothetical protein